MKKKKQTNIKSKFTFFCHCLLLWLFIVFQKRQTLEFTKLDDSIIAPSHPKKKIIVEGARPIPFQREGGR